ncbi:MAG: IS630 transposase-related protein [Janthinobacterium lividum]
MAGGYSADLRERVLMAVEAGEAVTVVARRFAVGHATVRDWVRTPRQDGRRTAGKMGGHVRPKMSDEAEAVLRRALEGANHLTLAQYWDRLAAEAGVSVHLSTVHRALARMKWSRKKAHVTRGRARGNAERLPLGP